MQPRTLALPLLLLTAACQTAPDWRTDLRRRLPRLGHRNVIAVVDAAYPAQTAAGVTTLHIGGDQVEAVRAVLDEVRAAGHVQCKAMLDRELASVAEAAAPGITAYRNQLDAALGAVPVTRQAHELVIRTLAMTASEFEVLVLKTDLKLPYTSVFLWLDCGYWDGTREAALRAALQGQEPDAKQEK